MFGDPFRLNVLNSSSCQQCNCDRNGSQNILCSYDGICTCKAGFIGDKCSDCASGYFGYPKCKGKKKHKIEC